jgi:hypothetical protein
MKRIRCIDNTHHENCLTIGKEYDGTPVTMYSGISAYELIDDDGSPGQYMARRFEEVNKNNTIPSANVTIPIGHTANVGKNGVITIKMIGGCDVETMNAIWGHSHPSNVDKCDHKWADYVGYSEAFTFCTICDKKKLD